MAEELEGEIIDISYPLCIDNLSKIKWRTKDRRIIPISELADTHLRNIALFLMGLGYSTCVASEESRIFWLSILRMEWERRQYRGLKIFRAREMDMMKQ